MLIIPAIDIKNGQCVRLVQGRMDAVTVYSDDPASTAVKWESLGARLIHLVDLDGAVEGAAKNFDVVKRIAAAVKVPVQIGGGIRDITAAQKYLHLHNVRRIILGTAALQDQDLLRYLTKRYPGRIAVGIDAKDGFVAINGWITVTDEKAVDLAMSLEDAGVAAIIYTDISRDGMLKGPNVAATSEMAGAVSIPVIASGGISSAKDVEAYRGVKLEGIIIGKALYTGGVDLKGVVELAEGF
ncbi:MAG: 1-(5-phosphoribosyl)-5-[(5-phosphoribosylamino)methylideneamino]imidazole-4-carboxamide isomerase [Deltaproteobacteria bacterium]|nr:1-(5-phosphoribosyl)-5-[(5-phosphoribosylamino)methylideneamino]imidazole-4-carboxamide isomerase [Deltaproteobacteria bacterium]